MDLVEVDEFKVKEKDSAAVRDAKSKAVEKRAKKDRRVSDPGDSGRFRCG